MFKIQLGVVLVGSLCIIPAHAAQIQTANGSNIVATALASWAANWVPLAFADQKQPQNESHNLRDLDLVAWAVANGVAAAYVGYHFYRAKSTNPRECGPAYFWTYVLGAAAGAAMASSGRQEEEITRLKIKLAELEALQKNSAVTR